MRRSEIVLVFLAVGLLLATSGCQQLSNEQRDFYVAVPTAVIAVQETVGGGALPMTEEELHRRLGPPDIRVSIQELLKRAESRQYVKELLEEIPGDFYVLVAPDQPVVSRFSWTESPYSEATLEIYDASLRYEEDLIAYTPCGMPVGTTGGAFLVWQGKVVRAGHVSQWDMTFVNGDWRSRWFAIVEPGDFVNHNSKITYPSEGGR